MGSTSLARDLKRCNGYEIYDTSLNKVTRSEAEFDTNTFLIGPDVISKLKSGLKKARTLPGQLGLSKFEYLRSELSNNKYADNIFEFVDKSSNAIKVKVNNDNWYIYENRDNTLINYCEKIFTLTQKLNIDVLASTLSNSLRRRSKKFDYPDAEVITKWIELSKWFRVTGKSAEFLGDKGELTELETSVVNYLLKVESSLYPPIKERLLASGYKKPAVDKAITTSPLVFVDKSGSRKTFNYSLISKAGAVSDESPQISDRYQDFKNKLKTLFSQGTDVLGESFSRREQYILRKWLFDDNTSSYCAICGENFSASALVTAHKKKRSLCNESERVDPYVVFPLCVFGCDYLYESGAIKIKAGKVVACTDRKSNTQDAIRAKELSRRQIDEEWLKGDLSYFEDN